MKRSEDILAHPIQSAEAIGDFAGDYRDQTCSQFRPAGLPDNYQFVRRRHLDGHKCSCSVPPVSRRAIKIWLAVVGALLLTAAGCTPSVIRFFEIDTCLDRGGGWNDETGCYF
ncbi:hypothetical protein [Phenylobacterium sp.]|uniref:hypothetical protein n=1 Tax=Phenylobacterium sp. TaxID=1871053 RepID=UPI0035AFE5CF